MMFWNRNKKEKTTAGNEKNCFDHLLSVAEKLPTEALLDLIRAIVRPVQSDFLLAVAEEGTLIPEHVYDMSWLFELVRTDGNHWSIDDQNVFVVST